MAEEKKRIINLDAKVSLDSGDYMAVDNSVGGTKKYAIGSKLVTGASITDNVIDFENDAGSTVFSVTLPVYDGGVS